MPARTLSSVLLPLPFGPTIPKNSPVLDAEGDVLECPLGAHTSSCERVEEVLLQRRPLLVREQEHLAETVDLDRGAVSLMPAPRTTVPVA